MSNEKVKSENFQNFGGINTKSSPYMTGPMEFLDLKNLDFQTPGSLCERWGSTMYVGQTFPGQINSLFEFARLDGSSYVLSSYSGGIFSGATTGNAQGLSLTLLGATIQSWAAVNFLQIVPPNPSGSNSAQIYSLGANFFGVSTSPVYGTGDPSGAGQLRGSTFEITPFAAQTDNTIDYAVLDNFLFMADGNKFLKYDGITTYPVGLPPLLWATNGVIDAAGNVTADRGFGAKTGSSTGANAIGFQFGPSFGIYYLYGSYVNNRGFEGPIWPLLAIRADNQFNASLVTSLAGATGQLQASITIATPVSYGISSINIYSFYDPYNTSIGQTFTHFLTDSFYQNVQSRFWNLGSPCLLQTVVASGTSFTSFELGTTNAASGISLSSQLLIQQNAFGVLEPTAPNSYFPIGLTLHINQSSKYPDYVALTGFYPRYIETFENRLFLAGFSSTPSTVWFSDVAEPEGYAPDFNFECRTNDGDYISGLKTYGTRLYVFKKYSFHVLIGDSPNNFSLSEVSDQYGCLNNRCIAVHDNVILFLDRKGVIEWNGSQISMRSQKIQPIFDRMNFSAALTNACMVHDKLRNQILVSIPVDGSTTNNMVCVFDYLVGAWTTYTGLSISSLAQIQGRNNTKNAFYGSYSGVINWFGASFTSDNGVGFTTYLKTRFLHDMGDSTQKMFRRMYLNTDSPASSTLTFGVNFFQDYGSSVVLGTTIVLSQFQNRIDFGVSAKSLAFEMSNLQSSIPLRIHGFTVESRFLRRV